MVSSKDEFRARTKAYALRVIQLVQALPHNTVADVIGKQLVRSATSVGANYRAACRAKSPADFIAKVGVVEEEADECLYWQERLVDSGLMAEGRLAALMAEGNELVTLAVASINTARKRSIRNPQSAIRNGGRRVQESAEL
jgi:four helix bundle protein